MTYFELVSYINNLKDTIISDEEINKLNQIDIHFTPEKYERFLNQFTDFIIEKMVYLIDNFIEKNNVVDIGISEFEIQIDLMKNNIQNLINVSRCKLLKEENKNEFITSIIESSNKIVDTLLPLYESEDFKEVIKRLYIKEA